MKPSPSFLTVMMCSLLLACGSNNRAPAPESITALNLKRGDVIACGPADKQFGLVDFEFTGKEDLKKDFNNAVALLHSFEYDEAEKVFARVIDQAPGCAMAYWGVAMSNFHALWTPPTEAELKKGSQAIAIAQSISEKSQRESDYIDAVAAFYKDWDKTDHRSRCIAFEKEMENLYAEYPKDKEAATFYALSLSISSRPRESR